MCVLASSSYLAILLVAARFAAAPASAAVSPTCDSAKVSGTVTSQAIGLPLEHRISVLPSGRFPFCRIKFALLLLLLLLLLLYPAKKRVNHSTDNKPKWPKGTLNDYIYSKCHNQRLKDQTYRKHILQKGWDSGTIYIIHTVMRGQQSVENLSVSWLEVIPVTMRPKNSSFLWLSINCLHDNIWPHYNQPQACCMNCTNTIMLYEWHKLAAINQ